MIRLLVLYGTPRDPEEFDRRYAEEHVPLALAMPRLVEYSYSRGPITSSGDGAAPYLMASLAFATAADREASSASSEGQAVSAHAVEIATGGMTLLTFEELPADPAAP